MTKNIQKQSIKIAFILLFIVSVFSSCDTVRENHLMGDVIGFSDNIQTSFTYENGFFKCFKPQSAPYNLLEANGRANMDNFIRNIPDGQNTVGYYALDIALDRIRYVRRKVMHRDPETKYYIVLLTDGLDNASCVVARNNHQGYYKNIQSYISKLNKKKRRVMGWKKKQNYFQIYPILFTGGELDQMRYDEHMSDDAFERFVMEQMEGYRGASKGTSVPLPLYGHNLDTLVKQFEEQLSFQDFEFHIPKGYLDTRVRMTLMDMQGNKATIEGTYMKKGFRYVFKDITFSPGLVSKSISAGGSIKSKNQFDRQSLLSIFMIDDLKLNGEPFKIAFVEQHHQESGVYDVPNSEYEAQADSRKNAYVIMIIDGSESFAENSALAKRKAIEMRQIVTK